MSKTKCYSDVKNNLKQVLQKRIKTAKTEQERVDLENNIKELNR